MSKTLKEVTIYTRGITSPSGAGSYGVVLLCEGHRKELSGRATDESNNHMDLQAAVEGLRALKFPCRVTLYNTNTYLTDAISKGWAQRWRSNGWRNSEHQPTRHADLWDVLLKLCSVHQVTFDWLRFDPANGDYRQCDALARAAAQVDLDPMCEELVEGKHQDRAAMKPGSTAEPVPSSITVTYKGKRYTWDGQRWYGTDDYTVPPQSILRKLDFLIAEQLDAEDAAVTDASELLSRAKRAQTAGHLERAKRLAERVCRIQSDNAGVAAVLCSILREMGQAGQALALADRYRNSNYPPILTSRAAALCDLERWPEALGQIRQVMAIGMRAWGQASAEGLAVHGRIKANAPQLFK